MWRQEVHQQHQNILYPARAPSLLWSTCAQKFAEMMGEINYATLDLQSRLKKLSDCCDTSDWLILDIQTNKTK